MDQLMKGFGVTTNGQTNANNPPPGYQGEAVLGQQSTQQQTVKKELTLKEKQELASKLENSSSQINNTTLPNSMSLKNFNNSTNTSRNTNNLTDSLMNKNLADLNTSANNNNTNKTTGMSGSTSNFDLLTQIGTSSTPSSLNTNNNSNINNTSFKSFQNPSTNNFMMNNLNMINNINKTQNTNKNNNEIVGFFGNLALPAPPTASATTNSGFSPIQPNKFTNDINFSTASSFGNLNMINQIKPPPQPSGAIMSIPLIPAPSRANNTANQNFNLSNNATKKNSPFDDLNDIFG
jgi:hypothetical protein